MNNIKKINAFFSYYGAKHQKAYDYPFPVFDTIIEPFAGGAGYATKHYYKNVILNDLYEQVYGMWHYLINVTEKEILELPVLNNDDSIDNLGNEIPQEAKWLIGYNLGVANPSTRKIPSKWMREGECNMNRFWGESKKKEIANNLKFIRHWKVYNESYEDLLEKLASDDILKNDITWHIDPPYQVKGYKYRYGKMNFEHLGIWCKSLKGQIMVCENKGADWLPFKDCTEIISANGNTSKEVIWINNTENYGLFNN